ncbi:hypothetical protein STEG23_003711, partial [Scotinomys teguina]
SQFDYFLLSTSPGYLLLFVLELSVFVWMIYPLNILFSPSIVIKSFVGVLNFLDVLYHKNVMVVCYLFSWPAQLVCSQELEVLKVGKWDELKKRRLERKEKSRAHVKTKDCDTKQAMTLNSRNALWIVCYEMLEAFPFPFVTWLCPLGHVLYNSSAKKSFSSSSLNQRPTGLSGHSPFHISS